MKITLKKREEKTVFFGKGEEYTVARNPSKEAPGRAKSGGMGELEQPLMRMFAYHIYDVRISYILRKQSPPFRGEALYQLSYSRYPPSARLK